MRPNRILAKGLGNAYEWHARGVQASDPAFSFETGDEFEMANDSGRYAGLGLLTKCSRQAVPFGSLRIPTTLVG